MIATTQLGSLFETGRLSLGGGGIGQVWGDTSTKEAEAVLQAALDAGVSLLDLAPLYKQVETFIGDVFAGAYPETLRISTKHMLGNAPIDHVLDRFEASLDQTCSALRHDKVDLLILHGYIIPDGWRGGPRAELLDHIATPWTVYAEGVIPAMQTLVETGRIAGWGITSSPMAEAALRYEQKPDVIHAITNALDSSGGMNITGEPETPGDMVALAAGNGVGVMGVRAVAAGALTSKLDRSVDPTSPEAVDYNRAQNFRELAAEFGQSPAQLAHRYALSIPGVDTVILGVKNRSELTECLEADALPPLTDDEMQAIRHSVGGFGA